MQHIYSFVQAVPAVVPLVIMFMGLLVFVFVRIPFYSAIRKHLSESGHSSNSDECKAVSVVICCRDEAQALEENLPAILAQRDVRMEVIVVDDASGDSTVDVLKRLENTYPNLRHTFVPKSARYVSREKLAVTLGVKAAKYDWVVLTRANCRPASDYWLKTMSKYFTADHDIVLGYSNFADNGTIVARRAIYERLMYALMWFGAARKRVFGGDGANLAFRRSLFLKKGGYASMLDFTFGVDDMLVNYLASNKRTAVCCKAEAIMRQQTIITVAKYRKMKLQRVAAQLNITAMQSAPLLRNDIMNAGQYMLAIGGVAAATMLFVAQNYIAGGAVCAFLAVVCATDIVLFRRATAAVGEPFYLFSLPYYEAVRPLAFLLWKLKYHIKRNDFRRKI